MKDAILIVEDNELVQRTLYDIITFIVDEEGVDVYCASDVKAALELFNKNDIKIVITDVNLGCGPDGISLVNDLNKNGKRPYIIIISSIPELHSIKTLLNEGKIDSYFSKPFSLHKLKAILEQSNLVKIES